MAGTRYKISEFVGDAKKILASNESLEQQKGAIGERLSELSKRDDLTRFGMPVGPSDASTDNYILWREPPYIALVLGQFDPGYLSPVHAHDDFWVVGCGYRGRDRWDIYERLDDGKTPGYADLRMVDQYSIPPGKSVWMPKPPRAIHSHNNEADGQTMEIIFSAAKPLPPERRIVFDVEAKTCYPSGFNLGGILVGTHYPPRPLQSRIYSFAERVVSRTSGVLRDGWTGGRLFRPRRAGCPICACLA